MAPKLEVATKQQLDDLAAKVAALEERDAANSIKIVAFETGNKALISRIVTLESNKSSNILDFSKLFGRKCSKSPEEIKITQGFKELNKDANKREKML